MKIHAFGVREDELASFQRIKEEKNLELILHKELLTKENIPLLEEGCSVSTLGMANYKEEEIRLLKTRNVFCLSTRTIGTNHIDLKTAKECGIHVCHASYAPNGVAEYTLMMILLCLRKYKISLWRAQVNDYSLSDLEGREIKDLTIGVIGTGKIGATLVKILSGFGCKLIVYDKYQNEEVKKIATYVSLDELYQDSDLISLHVPLNKETNHMINDETINKMKKGVILINCARGELMDIKALIRGIENEQIGALGLDTLENEEGVVHKNLTSGTITNRDMLYLRQFKNVYHTQHIAFYTDSAVKSMVETSILGILAIANNEKWPNQDI